MSPREEMLALIAEAVRSGRGRIDSDDPEWLAEDVAAFRARAEAIMDLAIRNRDGVDAKH